MAQTKIAGLFLDPTVISGLTAITDGASNADYLFVWDAGTSTLKKILPDNLGLAAAAHTIESHTATSATGANLETLTNAGDADALHTHNAKASLSGAVFTGTVTTPSVLFKGTSNSVTLDADNPAAYTVILPNAAPTGGGKVLQTASGQATVLEWGTPAAGGIASVAADTTPELGGNLDVVTHDIVSTSNRDIDITPHGTGATVLNGEVKGSRAFVSLMTDLIEGGTHRSLFVLGNHGYAAGVHNAYYGWGKEFQLYMSGSGSRTLMSQQANFRGKGWQIDSGADNARYSSLYAGGQVMAVNDDWTIIMRYFSYEGHTWGFGLVSNPQNYRPHNTASFNHIGIFGESGSSKPKLRTNASSNYNETVFTGTYSFAVEHVAKVTITEGGRYVKGYIDGILVGTHDANVTNDRVPQGAENMFLYINVSSYDTNVRTLHISDFIAYTEA